MFFTVNKSMCIFRFSWQVKITSMTRTQDNLRGFWRLLILSSPTLSEQFVINSYNNNLRKTISFTLDTFGLGFVEELYINLSDF